MTVLRWQILGLVLITLLTGCSSKPEGPATASAEGVVMLDGQPLEGATVVFLPQGSEGLLGCQAVTDASGRFAMQLHVGGGKYKSGAMPGTYSVTVNKLESGAQQTFSKPQNLLPEKYNSPQSSELTATVASDQTNQFQFDLESN